MSFPFTKEQRAWIDALRSGNYEQGKEVLRHYDKFCCLGVACDLFKDPLGLEVRKGGLGELFFFNGEPYGLPFKVAKHLSMQDLHLGETGFPGKIKPSLTKEEIKSCLASEFELSVLEEAFDVEGDINHLTDLNDSGFSFECIANVMETYPERIFENE